MTTELLKPRDAATVLQIHVVTLRRWTKAGKLPCVRYTDGTIRYRQADLDAFTAGALRWNTPPSREPRQIASARRTTRSGISSITGLPFRPAVDAAVVEARL